MFIVSEISLMHSVTHCLAFLMLLFTWYLYFVIMRLMNMTYVISSHQCLRRRISFLLYCLTPYLSMNLCSNNSELMLSSAALFLGRRWGLICKVNDVFDVAIRRCPLAGQSIVIVTYTRYALMKYQVGTARVSGARFLYLILLHNFCTS